MVVVLVYLKGGSQIAGHMSMEQMHELVARWSGKTWTKPEVALKFAGEFMTRHSYVEWEEIVAIGYEIANVHDVPA